MTVLFRLLFLLLLASPLRGQETEQGPKPRLADRHGDPLPEGAIQRFGSLRWRHPSITYLAALPDGKTAVSIGYDHTARWWDLDTGRQINERSCVGEMLSADGSVLAQTFFPNEANERRGVDLLDTVTGRILCHLEPWPIDGSVLAISGDGSRVAITGQNGRVTIHDCRTMKTTPVLTLAERPAPHMSFSPDGKRLLVYIHKEKRLSIRDADTGKELSARQGHAFVFAMNPAGDRLAVIDPPKDENNDVTPGRLRIADLKSGREIISPLPIKQWEAEELIFSPDGRWLLAAGSDTSYLIDSRTGEVARRLCGGRCGRFTPDGTRILLSMGNRLYCIETATGRIIADPGGDCDFENIRVSPDGRKLLAGNRRDGRLEVWDTRTTRAVATLDHRFGEQGEARFFDGGRMVRCNDDEQTFSWNLATGEVVRTFFSERMDWNQTCWLINPEGNRSAFFNHYGPFPDQKTRLSIIDNRTGQLIHRGQIDAAGGGDPQFYHVYWLPGGETGVERTKFNINIIDSRLKRPTVKIPGNLTDVSADGRWAVSDGCKLWETATWQEVESPSFSKERNDFLSRLGDSMTIRGRMLVVTEGKFLRVLDLAAGIECGSWPLPDLGAANFNAYPARKLCLFPDGKTVFTELRDGTGMTWDISGLPLKKLSVTHTEADLAGWWASLADEDPTTAYDAIWRMAETPTDLLMPFLRKHLRPVSSPTQEEWKKLVADLEHREYRVRAAALKRIEAFGTGAALEIWAALQTPLSADAREQLTKVMAKFQGPVPASEALRFLRALAVLEEVKTAEARLLVEELSHGVASFRETKTAITTLARMPNLESWNR